MDIIFFLLLKSCGRPSIWKRPRDVGRAVNAYDRSCVLFVHVYMITYNYVLFNPFIYQKPCDFYAICVFRPSNNYSMDMGFLERPILSSTPHKNHPDQVEKLTTTSANGKTIPSLKKRVQFATRAQGSPTRNELENILTETKPVEPTQKIFSLGADDKLTLLGPHLNEIESWLTDNIINGAQVLLKQQFPSDCGLRDTLLVNAGMEHLLDSTTPFVQIFHDAGNQHWITVTNTGCKENTIRVYCSLMYKPSTQCLLSIYRFVRCSGNVLTVQLMNVAKQRNFSDCGLYAIAFAESLLAGADPGPAMYKHREMRQHLFTCLQQSCMKPFPIERFRTVRKAVELEISHELHCICRGFSFGNMILCNRCNMWLHGECINMPSDILKRKGKEKGAYLCDRCTKEM